MAITIIRKSPPVGAGASVLPPPIPPVIPCFEVGATVRIGHLRFLRGKLCEGLHGVVTQMMVASGLRDVRPRDDLYRVQFAGFHGFLYYGELLPCGGA